MERQSDVRGLLASARSESDKTVVEGLVGNLGYQDDHVIAVTLAVKEMAREPSDDIVINDLVWAGAFLDHLDTQGFSLRRKRAK